VFGWWKIEVRRKIILKLRCLIQLFEEDEGEE